MLDPWSPNNALMYLRLWDAYQLADRRSDGTRVVDTHDVAPKRPSVFFDENLERADRKSVV